MSRRLAVVTIVHGRHDHLAAQLAGLESGTRTPDLHVVVAMDDPAVEDVVDSAAPSWHASVVRLGGSRERLPLAAARNRGVAEAVRGECQDLVLLDVDCIPDAGLLERYAAVLAAAATHGPAPTGHSRGPVVVCGEVLYLPPLPPGSKPTDPDHLATARAHAARPAVAPDDLVVGEDVTLFWSLSFAMTAADYDAVGGFDESYVGYGGEDTDFGQRLARSQGRLLWAGGARAFHQHHFVESPPVRHLEDVVRNANLFAMRWGWWPMEGWLTQFEELGLAARAPDGTWRVLGAPPSVPGPSEGP